MANPTEAKAFDVTLDGEKRKDFGQWLSREIENALAARTDVMDVRYWWTLYEQGRTRGENAPWEDAADFTSWLGTEKVDALRARIMGTLFADQVWTVEGWGKSSATAPFVEDFHQWAAESEKLQGFIGRTVHNSLIEPRGVLEVFEDTTTRVNRKTINAQVQTQLDPLNPLAPPTWVMDGTSRQPKLVTDDKGRYVEVFDAMTPSAQVEIDEVERVRKGPGYRVVSYEHFLILPAHAKEKADIFGYAKYFTKRWDQLQDAVRNGMYDTAALEAIHPSSEVAAALSPAGENIPVAAQEGPTAEKELWEVQVLHDLDGKGLRWYICTIHVPSRTLLRMKYDTINRGRFVLFIPLPRTDRAHLGYSIIGHKQITVIEEHTAWRNFGADRAALEMSAPTKRLQTALWEPDLQPMGPKAVIDVRDMNEVQPMEMPRLSDIGLQREESAITASERLIGINDVALGQSSQQSQTLGELEIRTEQSFVRINELIANLREPMEELGLIRHEIWKRTLQECEKYQADGYAVPGDLFQRAPKTGFIPQGQLDGLDEKGGDPTKDTLDPGGVKSFMLEGTFRFKPHGTPETANKAKQRADYMQGLQGLAVLFQYWPTLAQTIAMNPQAAKSAIEQWLRLFNIPDKQAWLGPIDTMMQAQAANPMGGMPMMPGMPPMPGAPGMPGMGQPPMGGPPPAGPQPPPQGAA